MSLSQKQVFGKRAFIVMAYIANALGVPRPAKPSKCPFAGDGDAACTIQIERWRPRICGIGFLLAGMRCLFHHRSFTIYPPGWAPYARQRLAPVDHSGYAIEQERGPTPWSDTVFAASLDASNNHLWPEEVHLGPSREDGLMARSRRTQRRHIAGAIRLFGLNISATLRDREVVDHLIHVGLSRLEAGAKKIREGPSLIEQGVEGVRVLEQLPTIRLMMTGLLTLGVNQGYWGPALLH